MEECAGNIKYVNGKHTCYHQQLHAIKGCSKYGVLFRQGSAGSCGVFTFHYKKKSGAMSTIFHLSEPKMQGGHTLLYYSISSIILYIT